MGSADSIQQVSRIITSNPERRVIVVSAMSGTTDELIELARLASTGQQYNKQVDQLLQKHQKAASDLGIDVDFTEFVLELQNLLEHIHASAMLEPWQHDHVLTFGERLSSLILTVYLQKEKKVTRIDSKELIETDSLYMNARVNVSATNDRIQEILVPALTEYDIVVVTGFIGSDKEGNYTTLGRGGSDYSAAVLARGLKVEALEIWTDVNGIMTTDPRMIPEAKTISSMSFNEAAELAFFGAKVLHPKTIQPAVEVDIPVYIKNTFQSDHPGTVITSDTEETIKSVTYRKHVYMVNICSTRMLEAKGFLSKLFQVFEKHQIPVDALATSEVSVSMTLNVPPSQELITDLEEIATVRVENEKALICLVGEGIKQHPEVLADLFGSIRGHSVEMVSQGASQRNITLIIEQQELEGVVKKIYKTFF